MCRAYVLGAGTAWIVDETRPSQAECLTCARPPVAQWQCGPRCLKSNERDCNIGTNLGARVLAGLTETNTTPGHGQAAAPSGRRAGAPRRMTRGRATGSSSRTGTSPVGCSTFQRVMRQAPPRRRSRGRPPPKRSCAPAPTFVIHVVPSASGVWRGRGTFSGARPLAMASHARARSQHSGSSHSNAHCDEPFHSSCQDGSRASRAWVPVPGHGGR